MSEINSGLEGVVVAETKISKPDGLKGQLVYRGYNIQDLVKNSTYEDIVFLICNGRMPDQQESTAFRQNLANRRTLPDYVIDILKKLPKNFNCMAALRTGISALTMHGEEWPPTLEQGLDIIAKAPTIIACFYQHSLGKKEIAPDINLGHTENYLYMLHGKKPEPSFAKALDAYLITTIDHGLNASTFTARVVTSTRSDMVSAITAAVGALKGPLHGGAPSEVDAMLDEIGNINNVEPWLRAKLDAGERIMGFGHRVYKTYDPRAAILKEIVKALPNINNEQLALSLAVEKTAVHLLEEYKPGRNLYPNVEFWAAAVLRTVNIPKTIYSPTFGAARTAGWVANILEQAENNRLIRPSANYTGHVPEMLGK